MVWPGIELSPILKHLAGTATVFFIRNHVRSDYPDNIRSSRISLAVTCYVLLSYSSSERSFTRSNLNLMLMLRYLRFREGYGAINLLANIEFDTFVSRNNVIMIDKLTDPLCVLLVYTDRRTTMTILGTLVLFVFIFSPTLLIFFPKSRASLIGRANIYDNISVVKVFEERRRGPLMSSSSAGQGGIKKQRRQNSTLPALALKFKFLRDFTSVQHVTVCVIIWRSDSN